MLEYIDTLIPALSLFITFLWRYSTSGLIGVDVMLGPYSNFRVGAAVLTDDGAIVSGANVECASFPVGLCAERCALAKAVVCRCLVLS